MKDIGQQDNHDFYFYECDVNYANCSILAHRLFTTSDLAIGINTFSFPRITLTPSKWYYFHFVFRGSGQNWKLGYSDNDAWTNGHFVYWGGGSYVPYDGEKDLYFIITSPVSLK
ncbi:hypothetical protein HZC21_05425 [Candidatus Peregrinibacteria bacterium]|nr:hypothetical protein [Candidatus Peregrinibacteria bacterium]